MRVSDAVEYILADHYLSEAEVETVLEPALASEPIADATALLHLAAALNDPTLGIGTAAARRVYADLAPRGIAGLQVPAPRRPLPMSQPTTASPIVNGSSMTGPDPVFTALAQVTGHPRDAEGVYIAIADLPVDFSHPALAEHRRDQRTAWDFVDSRALVPDPGQWHGTANAALSVQGTPRLRVMASQVLPSAAFDATGRGIESSIARGARVINISADMETPANAEALARVAAAHPNVLFMVAAGNGAKVLGPGNLWSKAVSPADNIMVVGAATAKGGIWRRTSSLGSNAGSPWVTVAADGENIRLPYSMDQAANGNTWVTASGTSFACPQVSNCAGKMMLLCPELEPRAVRYLIMQTVDKTAAWQNMNAAGGVLNARRAMTAAAAITLVRERGYTVSRALVQLGCTPDEYHHLLPVVEAMASAMTAK